MDKMARLNLLASIRYSAPEPIVDYLAKLEERIEKLEENVRTLEYEKENRTDIGED